MGLAAIFSFWICAGLLLLVAAYALLQLDGIAQVKAAVLARFSGRPAKADPAAIVAKAPAALRRTTSMPTFIAYLPGMPRAENFASFYTELRRLTPAILLGVSALVTLLLYTLLRLNVLIGMGLGVVLAGLVWYVWARMRYQKRLRKIEESVPEALDLVVRALRVGLPIATAIQTVGQELVGPLAEEFAETAQQISYGQDPLRALREMAERCQNQSLRFFAAAVALQSQTGGNLAEVLERLCAIARGRQQLQRKVRSITAEAKWSGRFLSFFPLMATAMLLMVNPNYFSDISDKDFFLPLLAIVATLLVLNMVFMRWLVKIE